MTLLHSRVHSPIGTAFRARRVSMTQPLLNVQVSAVLVTVLILLAGCAYLLAPLAGVAVAGLVLLFLSVNYPPLILFVFFAVLGTMWTFDEWPITPLRPAVGYLVGVTLAALMLRRTWPRLHWIAAIVAAFGAWMYVAVSISGDLTSSSSYAVTVVGWAFAILALVQYGDGKTNLLLLSSAFVTGICAGSVGVIYHFLQGDIDGLRPVNGDVNDFGVLLAAALMLSMGICLTVGVPLTVKIPVALLTVPIAVVTVGSLSRGTYLAIGLGLVALIVGGRRQRRAFAWIAALGVVGLGAVALIMGDRLGQAFEQKRTIAGENVDSRFEAWNLALRLWGERPVTGFGVGTIGEHLSQVYSTPPGAFVVDLTHNTYVEVLYGTGVVGAILFTVVLLFCLRNGIGLPATVVPILPTTVAVFVASFTVTEIPYAPFWVLTALAAAADIARRNLGSDTAPNAETEAHST